MWNISIDFTLVVMLESGNVTLIPGFIMPEHTEPVTTVPTPETLKTFQMGKRRGFS